MNLIEKREIFPRVREHTHGSTVVETPGGDLLAAWFQGSGERNADDVRIMGARLKSGSREWSAPFLMADVPGFPDVNPILFWDPRGRLWLVWYTVIAHQWDTSLLQARMSERFEGEGAPNWDWQKTIFVKPGSPAQKGVQPNDRFLASVKRQAESYRKRLGGDPELQARWNEWSARMIANAAGEPMTRRGILKNEDGTETPTDIGYPYFRRMGWQTKNKAVIVNGGRLILPLYSDGFSFSLMALSDDSGETWQFSEPLVGAGSIQPSVAVKADGTLAAYMRDNGPPPKRLHYAESTDNGMTWSDVIDSELPNPGSGADIVTLSDGRWALAYNDTERGRHSLAVSFSEDEGASWARTLHLERDDGARSSYPSIIQARDGVLNVVYSSHQGDPRANAIKWARIEAG